MARGVRAQRQGLEERGAGRFSTEASRGRATVTALSLPLPAPGKLALKTTTDPQLPPARSATMTRALLQTLR